MAKGQKKSNREAKKPKQTDAEKLKSKTPAASLASQINSEKPKK